MNADHQKASTGCPLTSPERGNVGFRCSRPKGRLSANDPIADNSEQRYYRKLAALIINYAADDANCFADVALETEEIQVAENRELFVDFETGNKIQIAQWLNILKNVDPASGAVVDTEVLHPEFKDENINAILGYLFWKGFYNIFPNMRLAKNYLADGVSSGSTSSLFLSSIRLLDRGVPRGVEWLEECARREYPPALLALGMAQLKDNWVKPNTDAGINHVQKAMNSGYIPAKLFWHNRMSQPPYEPSHRLKAVARLIYAKSQESIISAVDPFSKRLSFFKNL